MVERIRNLFTTIDSSDSAAFGTFLAEDCRFQFGNAEAVQGKEAATAAVHGFFASIKSLKHDISAIKVADDTVLSHGIVTYTRHNGTTLTVPFANVMDMAGDHVRDYRIYIDASQLYAE